MYLVETVLFFHLCTVFLLHNDLTDKLVNVVQSEPVLSDVSFAECEQVFHSLVDVQRLVVGQCGDPGRLLDNFQWWRFVVTALH